MSTTPPEGPPEQPAAAPIPPGYKPGDYIPYADRDRSNPTAVAGEATWTDQVQQHTQAYAAQQGPIDPYRALYGWDAPVRVEMAGWSRRVLAYLFDAFLYTVALGPAILGYVFLVQELSRYTDLYGASTSGPGFEPPPSSYPLIAVGLVMGFVFWIYNYCLRQGRTGYTLGKTVVGIKLVSEKSHQPIGTALSFVRQIAHFVDGLVCNLGYLWPIWDVKKQTFADKIMGTVVIIQPQETAADPAGHVAQELPQDPPQPG
jgi:uncharacterized RDD family membrane protein YckC